MDTITEVGVSVEEVVVDEVIWKDKFKSKAEQAIAARILSTMRKGLFFTKSSFQPHLQLTGSFFGPVLDALIELGLVLEQKSVARTSSSMYYLPVYEGVVEQWRTVYATVYEKDTVVQK